MPAYDADQETESYDPCPRCDDPMHPADRIRVRAAGGSTYANECVCRNCAEDPDAYGVCDADCGRFVPTEDLFSATSATLVCRTCVSNSSENWTECGVCGEMWSAQQMRYCCEPDHDGYDSDCDCGDCRESSDYIHNYSYRPFLQFNSLPGEVRRERDRYGADRDRTLYMGFELEVEVSRGSRADAARRLVGDGARIGADIYLKEDSSIDHGFEIVSHPMTLDYAMGRFDWSLLRAMRLDGTLTTPSNCGLHVHVSRAGFAGPAHEYRWLLFIYRNQEIFTVLADRRSSYAQFDLAHRATFADLARGRTPAYAERYAAVNTENEATLEVRLFASTLYVNRLKAALQLVESTVVYTRSLATGKIIADGGFSFAEYVAWLRQSPERYTHLIQRIDAGLSVVRDAAEIKGADTFGHGRPTDPYSYRYERPVVRKQFVTQEKVSI